MVDDKAREGIHPVSAKRGLWRNPDAVLRERDEHGGLLFNPDTGEVRVLNPTGLALWDQCDGSRDVEELVQTLIGKYDDVSPDDVRRDVAAFVVDLLETGLLGRAIEGNEWGR